MLKHLTRCLNTFILPYPTQTGYASFEFWPIWVQYDSNCGKLSYFSIYVYSESTTKCLSIWHGVLTHLSSHIPLRLATPLLSFGHSVRNMSLTAESFHTSQYTFILSPQRMFKCLTRWFNTFIQQYPTQTGYASFEFWPIWVQYDSNCWKLSYFSINVYFKYTTKCLSIWHGVLTHLSNHIPLRLATPLLSFGQTECNMTLTAESSHTSQ